MTRLSRILLMSALCTGMAAPAAYAQGSGIPHLKTNPKCEVPFPTEAFQNAPAGFNGETLAVLSFTVKGEFRSARLLRTSGNDDLDRAALRAAVGARCEALGDTTDPQLQDALIGIPYAFTFDNSRGAGPAQTLPVR